MNNKNIPKKIPPNSCIYMLNIILTKSINIRPIITEIENIGNNAIN